MRDMRAWVLGVVMMLGAIAHGAELRVFTDLDEARAVAAKEGRQLVIEFSGRTWCPPCKSLTKEVMTSEAFAAFAASRVFVHLDYPRRSERTPEKVAADPELAKLMAHHAAFAVEGFPTVVLLDPAGRELGRVLGYEAGTGPQSFLAELSRTN